MKKIQLLSVVFSLIMFTGVTAGTAIAYAESEDNDHDFDDRLEHFCEMTDAEKEQLFIDHPRLAQFEERLTNYCDLDEMEREDLIEEFIEEHFADYKEQDDWDMDDILDRYCEMTEEDQAAFLEKYPMASDHQDKMVEYCTLDESEREAFIDEHKDEYGRVHDYDIKAKLDGFCEMSPEELAPLVEEHGKGEDNLADVEEYCILDDLGRDAFIEEHKDEFTQVHDYDMRAKLDAFCEMSEEDQTALVEEHGKGEDHLADVEEYCTLDDSGRDVFMEEHKDTMKGEMSDHKDTMKGEMSDHKDTMKGEMSDHKDTMKGEMSDHKDSMTSVRKSHMVLKASTLTDEQKDEIKAVHEELRYFKQSLRDNSMSDSEKQEIRDQFMETAKEFSMTWLSPRHQVAAGIDAQMVECHEGFTLVMKTSNASPICVKETTAEKLIERGIVISSI
ncbi:MAG TPA: ABC transporter substrate-binding protein [Nitrosopumilaceae archaeon]|nr:ABC transporter substrate-binding protein [Nitrosopumilaceae archaeon]